MALIQTVSPEEAAGRVAEVYERMLKVAPVVPKPLQMMSSSPELLSIMFQSLSYFLGNKSFSPLLLGHIRLLVAHQCDYGYCVTFNTRVLQMLSDVTDEQIEALKSNPSVAALDDREKPLLLFVLKAVGRPAEVEAGDVEALRALGWTDQEILEATHYGADMVRHGILFKAFQMDA